MEEKEQIKEEVTEVKSSNGGYSGIALVGVLSSITAIIMAMVGIGFVTFFK